MPIIGRLDSQVNDVLIESVGKKRVSDETGERSHVEQIGRELDEAAHAHVSEGDMNAKRAETKFERACEENRARGDDLPVWLL